MTKYGGRRFCDAGSNPIIYFAASVLLRIALNVLSAEGSILSPVFRALWPWRSREPVSSIRRPGGKYRGVVVLVSVGGGFATARKALSYHGEVMKHAWLIHSEASSGNAETLKSEFPVAELV